MPKAASIETISEKRNDLVVVHQHCPDRPYIELHIPDDFLAARHVRFTTVSRDQGWCDEGAAGEYSWFDATVKRPFGRNNLRTIRVCFNRPGNPKFHKQTADWHPNHPWGVNWKPWVKALAPGDVIELVPRAIYQGWLNIVREAQIELEYETLGVDTPSTDALHFFRRNTYPYARRLDEASLEIRVLAIQPGLPDDPIICQFYHVRLNEKEADRQPFDALSYTWGYPKDMATIEIQPHGPGSTIKHLLSVPPSAQDAIRRLRNESQIQYLWIDAVCINQLDNDEKAWQVRNMASIFSAAETVHVWLGEHPGIEAALRIIRDTHNYGTRVCDGGAKCHCDGTKHSPVEELAATIESHPEKARYHWDVRMVFDYHWKSFDHWAREYAGGLTSPHISRLMPHLFDHPWFRRSWVIREVLMSKSTLVHCGQATITWKELVDVNSLLADARFNASEPHLLHSYVTMPLVWSRLTTATSQIKGQGDDVSQKLSILEVYLSAIDFKSTQARDKLFSVLSFGRETSNANALPHELKPDYTKSEQQVFADFTKWWIKENRSLSILSSIHSECKRTWVRILCDTKRRVSLKRPTWTVPTDGSPRRRQATLDYQFNFKAAGNTFPDLNLLEDSSDVDRHQSPRLRVTGFRVTQISELTFLLPLKSADLSSPLQQEIFDVYHKIIDPSNLHQHWKERLTNITITEDRMAQNQGGFNDHLFAHWQYTSQPKLSATDPTNVKRSIKIRSIPTCLDPFAFIASNGMFGLCPWFARPDDIVVLLHGGNVPYLLRQTTAEAGAQAHYPSNEDDEEEVFELIGGCFVQGVMHGEHMQVLIDAGTEPEVFTLV